METLWNFLKVLKSREWPKKKHRIFIASRHSVTYGILSVIGDQLPHIDIENISEAGKRKDQFLKLHVIRRQASLYDGSSCSIEATLASTDPA